MQTWTKSFKCSEKKSCIAKDDITTPLTLMEIVSSYQSSEMIDYRREVD